MSFINNRFELLQHEYSTEYFHSGVKGVAKKAGRDMCEAARSCAAAVAAVAQGIFHHISSSNFIKGFAVGSGAAAAYVFTKKSPSSPVIDAIFIISAGVITGMITKQETQMDAKKKALKKEFTKTMEKQTVDLSQIFSNVIDIKNILKRNLRYLKSVKNKDNESSINPLINEIEKNFLPRINKEIEKVNASILAIQVEAQENVLVDEGQFFKKNDAISHEIRILIAQLQGPINLTNAILDVEMPETLERAKKKTK